MPDWHDISIGLVALAFAAYFKCVCAGADHFGPAQDRDTRLSRLKNYRMERGECVCCAAPLPDGTIARTLTSSVCARCRPDHTC